MLILNRLLAYPLYLTPHPCPQPTLNPRTRHVLLPLTYRLRASYAQATSPRTPSQHTERAAGYPPLQPRPPVDQTAANFLDNSSSSSFTGEGGWAQADRGTCLARGGAVDETTSSTRMTMTCSTTTSRIFLQLLSKRRSLECRSCPRC